MKPPVAYLRNHVPEILSALEDRERLDWLINGGQYSEVWRKWSGDGPFEETFRAAIDEARKASKP